MTKPKAKKLEDGTMVLSTVKQKLLCKLDEKAMGVAGVRLANLLQKHGEFEVQAKGVRDNLKQQEALIQADIDLLADGIRLGAVEQEVDVEVRADFTAGRVEFVRLDTSETVSSRALTDNERQKKMIFDTEESDEAADEAIERGEVPKLSAKDIAEPTPEAIREYFKDEDKKEPPANG